MKEEKGLKKECYTIGDRRRRVPPEAHLNGEHAWEGGGRRETAGGGGGGSTARARE